MDDKKEIMLDLEITAIIAKELFESEHCSDNAALIDGNDESDAIANKLKENCDQSCLAEMAQYKICALMHHIYVCDNDIIPFNESILTSLCFSIIIIWFLTNT